MCDSRARRRRRAGDWRSRAALHSPPLLPTGLRPGPSHHQGGVGLLLSLALLPRVRCYMRHASGRLMGAVLELSGGHRLLLVSAYMPSGLDHRPADSEEHELARKLYATILQWSAGLHAVVVLGDLNETRSRHDRLPLQPARASAVAAAASPMLQLQHDGFTDVYRALHPSAQLSPGFTHILDGARPSQSRIDYIWSKGVSAASLLQCHIDTTPTLRALSHHRLLWAEMRLASQLAAHCNTPLLRLRLPNLRAAKEAHVNAFTAHLTSRVEKSAAELLGAACSDDSDALGFVAAGATALVRRSAFACFPVTGDAAYSSRDMLQLQQQRLALTRLLRIATSVLRRAPPRGDCFARHPQWQRQYRECVGRHKLQWRHDAWHGCNPHDHDWMDETARLLSSTRSAMRRQQKRMQREQRPPLDRNPAALNHRMLKSDALPAQLHSIVDAQGQLTSSAAELEQVIVDHFSASSRCPLRLQRRCLALRRLMLFDKSSVEPQWYRRPHGAMSEGRDARHPGAMRP